MPSAPAALSMTQPHQEQNLSEAQEESHRLSVHPRQCATTPLRTTSSGTHEFCSWPLHAMQQEVTQEYTRYYKPRQGQKTFLTFLRLHINAGSQLLLTATAWCRSSPHLPSRGYPPCASSALPLNLQTGSIGDKHCDVQARQAVHVLHFLNTICR